MERPFGWVWVCIDGGSMCWEGHQNSFVSFSLSSDVQSALEDHTFSSEACQLWGQVNKPILPHYPPPPHTPTNLLPQAHTSPSLHLPLSMHLCPECRWNYHSVETSAKSRLLHPFPCSRSGLEVIQTRRERENPGSPATGHENRLSLGTSQSLALTLSSRPPGVKHNRLRATRSVRHWDTLNLPGLSASRLHDWENLCLPESFAPGYRVNPSPLSF